MKRFVGAGVVMLALLAGAAGLGTQSAGAQGKEDVMKSMETAREEIRKADIAFYEALKARNKKRFMEFIADEGRFYGQAVSVGPKAVSDAWAAFFDASRKTTLQWMPETVDVATSADFGYSRGDYELRAPGPGGKVASSYGHYVSIWKKSPDGRWRVMIDIGTPPGAKPAETAMEDDEEDEDEEEYEDDGGEDPGEDPDGA